MLAGSPQSTMSAYHTSTPQPERFSLTSEQFAQIKQHYEPTVHPPEVPSQDPEIVTSFQKLQEELQSFLYKHLSDTIALQDRILRKETVKKPDGGVQTIRNSGNMSMDGPDLESRGSGDIPSVQDAELKNRLSHRVPVPDITFPVQEHIDALHAFLTMHTLNLKTLQKSQREMSGQRQEIAHKAADSDGPAAGAVDFDNFNQQFNMQVLESTFTAALIVSFLSLVVSITSDRSTTFNVGMFFAFISVGIHFGNIVIAGRGVALTAQNNQSPDKDDAYFRHYLGACEQLQFAATLVFVLSTIIMTFIMFSSIAYPLVLLGLSLAGLIIVFTSVYWEVSMTFHNLKYLAQNVQRLRTSWNAVSDRHRRRVARIPTLYRREKYST